jgi:hypothetical protein
LKLKQRKNEVLGTDFDGIFNVLLPPIQKIMYDMRPGDLWERSHLTKIRVLIVKLYSYLPFILNGDVVNTTPRNAYIISGRIIRSSAAKKSLEKYGFRFFFFRPNSKISELEWKLRMCKLLGITEFYDDRPEIVKQLRMSGIKAHLWKRDQNTFIGE